MARHQVRAVAGPRDRVVDRSPHAPRQREPATGGLAGQLLGLQRRVGNRTTVSLLGRASIDRSAMAQPRIQRATRCSDWWVQNGNGQPTTAFLAPQLKRYWATLQPDLELLGYELVPADVIEKGGVIAQLDVLADFLNELVAFWNDTTALRTTAGVTTKLGPMLELTREDRAAGFQTARAGLAEIRSSWTEVASAMAGFESSKSAMKNACTIKLLDDHIVGYPNALDENAVIVQAGKIARGRTTRYSTVINLSDGGIRRAFEDEIAGTFEAKDNDLETTSFYPVVHIDRNQRLQQVGRARVRITRDKEGATNKRFHHLADILSWQGGEPQATAWK